MKKILILDNNDSFTYNIVELIKKNSNNTVDVVKSTDCELSTVDNYKKIIFSPGPGVPDDFPILKTILNDSARFGNKHILGICLGFQAICQFYGGELINKSSVTHGERHLLSIEPKSRLFEGITYNAHIGLYHSWEINAQSIKPPLRITGYANGSLMAVESQNNHIYGVQFHPESYISNCGDDIITNFLNLE